MRKKKKELDQLTIDSTNAIKAGLSYGKYMAIKPKTDVPVPKIKSGVEYQHTCEFCGKDFVTYTRQARKFCSDHCREQSYYEIKRVYPRPQICSICGKEFMAQTFRNKYCSEFCSKVAHGQRVKEYMARKAKEAKCNG